MIRIGIWNVGMTALGARGEVCGRRVRSGVDQPDQGSWNTAMRRVGGWLIEQAGEVGAQRTRQRAHLRW